MQRPQARRLLPVPAVRVVRVLGRVLGEMKTARFRGVTYEVDIDSELHGVTINSDAPLVREIVVSAHLPPRKYLDCLVHEGLHACFANASESEINAAATDLARFLWRAGFRRVT